VYQRKDRPGFWITWTDAQGHRRYRKTDAANITQAKRILAAVRMDVERARILGLRYLDVDLSNRRIMCRKRRMATGGSST
jgi:hypothetical protein